MILSRQAHAAKVHKRKLSGIQIAKKMWVKGRKDPDLVPSLKAGQLSRTMTMKDNYMKKRALTRFGHELVPVESGGYRLQGRSGPISKLQAANKWWV